MTSDQPLHTIQFGPYRALGMSYIGKNQNQEIRALWEQFLPRLCSDLAPLMRGGCVGVCRCVPGKSDGTFEYVAALLASPEATVPEGLIAVDIPQGEYAAFNVPELDQCMAAWQSSAAQLTASEEFSAYCGTEGCDCATHPSFEFYPPDYRGCGPFSLYMPVKRKSA